MGVQRNRVQLSFRHPRTRSILIRDEEAAVYSADVPVLDPYLVPLDKVQIKAARAYRAV